MKHLLLFFFLLGVIPSWAQTYTCTEAVSRQQHLADSLLQPLDKSQIPTHILYDRVAPQAKLEVFNLRNNNPDTSGVHHFLQAYYELHQADYTNPHTAPCRQVLADNARHYRQQDTLLIGVLLTISTATLCVTGSCAGIRPLPANFLMWRAVAARPTCCGR